MGAVIPHPTHDREYDPAKAGYLKRDDPWPSNVVTIRKPPPPVTIPATPERVLLQALVQQLSPKAHKRLVKQLAAQRRSGCPHAGVAFLIATGVVG